MSIDKRKKVLVFFDVDNTIVNGYTQKLFIKYLVRKKIIKIHYLFFGYLWFMLYNLRIVRDVKKPMAYFWKSIRGLGIHEMDDLLNDFFNKEIRRRIFSGAVDKIKSHLQKGEHVILLSTSIFPLINKIAYFLGVLDVVATKLDKNDYYYLGTISGSVIDGSEKIKIAKSIIRDWENRRFKVVSYFYSDHYSDYDLLDFVDNPIAVNPDDVLYKISKNKKWKILNFK